MNWHTRTLLFSVHHKGRRGTLASHTAKGIVMNKAAPSPRWFSGWRAAERPVQDDPADLGTAFGLDLSLNELIHEPQPPRRRSWMQRLALRRKPTP